jgi:hypothetical protein
MLSDGACPILRSLDWLVAVATKDLSGPGNIDLPCKVLWWATRESFSQRVGICSPSIPITPVQWRV